MSGITQTLTKATPLLLVALGIVIAFRARMINIGGEGQIIAGAMASTAFALNFAALPAWLLLPATAAAGALAGGAWAFVPGILKARLGANEILTTVMMNVIALQVMLFLLSGPMLDPAQIAAGTNIPQSDHTPAYDAPPLLAMHEVSTHGDRGGLAVDRVSLEVYPGEIVGVAGVSGNGQKELAEVLAGVRSLDSGQIEMEQRDISQHSLLQRMHDGVAYIPEERMRDGVILSFNVAENLILRDHSRQPYASGIFLVLQRITDISRHLIATFRIKTPGHQTVIKNLSGGNIQKVIMARELNREPRLLIAAQPTRGVDIGATEYIHELLINLRAQGAGVLLISEDLDEVLKLSDRIAVMFEGRVMDVLPRSAADTAQIGLLMAGVNPATTGTVPA